MRLQLVGLVGRLRKTISVSMKNTTCTQPQRCSKKTYLHNILYSNSISSLVILIISKHKYHSWLLQHAQGSVTDYFSCVLVFYLLPYCFAREANKSTAITHYSSELDTKQDCSTHHLCGRKKRKRTQLGVSKALCIIFMNDSIAILC